MVNASFHGFTASTTANQTNVLPERDKSSSKLIAFLAIAGGAAVAGIVAAGGGGNGGGRGSGFHLRLPLLLGPPQRRLLPEHPFSALRSSNLARNHSFLCALEPTVSGGLHDGC